MRRQLKAVVAVLGCLALWPAAATAAESVLVSTVRDVRSGYQPALSFRLNGVARSSGEQVVTFAARSCASSGAREEKRSPHRQVTVTVSGAFSLTEQMENVPSSLWQGTLCSYLEDGTGSTIATDHRHYRIASYRNPVYGRDFPDPMVLDVGNRHRTYYAYGSGPGIRILRSSDLIRWRTVGTAFTRRPGWVIRGGTWDPWAPDVLQDPRPCPGAAAGPCFIMYFSSLSEKYSDECIGVATAPPPSGPFTSPGMLSELGAGSGMPIGCGDSAGSSNIDPDPFIDVDGKAYLYISTGASCSSGRCRWRPTISVLPLSKDLLQAAGPREPLFSGDPGSWEEAPWGPVVEGPFMVLRGGTYFLFYSGGAWTRRYGMGYATSSSPTGPFVKSSDNPLLTDSRHVFSAGGGSLVTGPSGGTWVVYAGRPAPTSSLRFLRIDRVHWETDGLPSISGPTNTPQAPVP